ncbi:acyltransferase [Flavobacterium gilvum]|uniref:acyltransferase n=1 Tax=Flavobacterium gilvum TaxID=1492737 RepID=UPI001E3DD89D|nr:transferase [Flavobacterium gilvum]
MRTIYHKIKFYYSVNWAKTLYFNFKKFPFSIAKKLPFFFYGKVKFTSIKGEIIIRGNIKRGMIGFGQPYEMNTLHKGIAEIFIEGKMIFNGYMQFGKDYFIYIGKNAYCELGNMSSLGTDGKLICIEKIVLGEYCRIGHESQIMDSNFHPMIDTLTGEKLSMTAPINLGNYNYVGNRVSIMSKTKTADYCTIASNSICNKDYFKMGSNILIGGIPAKLIRENISRDWEWEKEALDAFLMI